MKSRAGSSRLDLRPRPAAVRPGLAGGLAAARGVETWTASTLSREPLSDETIQQAALVAFYLPMHTATRLAAPVIDRVRIVNPDAIGCRVRAVCAAQCGWLRERGVSHVLGPEAEEELVALANSPSPTPNAQLPTRGDIPRLQFIQPDRSTLLPLQRYAALQMPDGSRRVGRRHRRDARLQAPVPSLPDRAGLPRRVSRDPGRRRAGRRAGAGRGRRPAHLVWRSGFLQRPDARAPRRRAACARNVPGVTYDVTIKIEHLLKHAEMLPLLRDTGCLFVTSAVESIDPVVLERLRKGHTRADFVAAVALCRDAGVHLSPTFVPFTPWTTTGRLRRAARSARGAGPRGRRRADSARHPAARHRRFGAAGARRDSPGRGRRSTPAR